MLMEEKKIEGIPPYRMSQIVKAAADITDRMVNGRNLFNPTYHECEIVIGLVAEAIKKSKGKQEEEDVCK